MIKSGIKLILFLAIIGLLTIAAFTGKCMDACDGEDPSESSSNEISTSEFINLLIKKVHSLAMGNYDKGNYREAKQKFKVICELPETEEFKKLNLEVSKDIANACYHYGVMEYKGLWGEINKPNAMTLFTTACKHRNAEACNRKGKMYRDGEVGEKKLDVAKEAFHIACEYGSMDGCYNLGKIHDSKHQAKNLFLEACRGKHREACEEVEKLKNKTKTETFSPP